MLYFLLFLWRTSIKPGKSQVTGAVTKICEKADSILSQMGLFCCNICVKMVSI